MARRRQEHLIPHTLLQGSQEDLAQRLYTLLSQAKPLAPAAAHPGKRKAAEALEEEEPQESWCGGLESGAAAPSNAGEGTKQRKKRRQTESGQVRHGKHIHWMCNLLTLWLWWAAA